MVPRPYLGASAVQLGGSLAWQHLDNILARGVSRTWAAVFQAVVSGVFHAWAVYWMSAPIAKALDCNPNPGRRKCIGHHRRQLNRKEL